MPALDEAVLKSLPDKLPLELGEQVRAALAEDVGSGDISAELIPVETQSSAQVISREDTVLAGKAWFDEVFRQLDSSVKVEWQARDGEKIKAEQVLCTLSGPSRALLSGERSALNFIQLLSSTAATTRRFVDAIRDTGACILDTRKTVPGLRTAQKYAVLCGGGSNHRMGLYDAFLIKENHIHAAGSIAAAVDAARQQHGERKVEVEVENLHEVREALAAGADQLLLDNMTLANLREAVAINRADNEGRVKLEASGGVDIEGVRSIAQTGVDFISVGALTKDVRAVDLSMRFAD